MSSAFVRRAAAPLAALLTLTLAAHAADFPKNWPTASPESQGLSTPKLDAMWRQLDRLHSTALVVVRNDRLVYQRYAPGYSLTKPHYAASMSKALVGGMSLMLAMSDGRIRPGDHADRYVSEWRGVPLKEDITVAELATHTSGIDDAESYRVPHKRLTGWKGDFWKYPPLPPPRDPFTLARDAAPVIFTPGTDQRYSNPGMAMLGYCVTASLRNAPQKDLRALLRERVMDPIGVPADEWDVGYGVTEHVDGLPLVATWGGSDFSPNATARIARLVLHDGNWQGRQLISRRVVEEATHYAGLPNSSGLGWWVNRWPSGRRVMPSAPADACWGLGAGDQFVMIVPSLNLIVVRNGDLLARSRRFDEPVERYVVAPLMAAFLKPPAPAVNPAENRAGG